jgi:hypothetical protein
VPTAPMDDRGMIDNQFCIRNTLFFLDITEVKYKEKKDNIVGYITIFERAKDHADIFDYFGALKTKNQLVL